MLSTQEAKNGAGVINGKEIIPIRQALEDIGHAQGLAPFQFDNKCTTDIINDKIRQTASKCMYIRFYWLRNRLHQWQVYVYWY